METLQTELKRQAENFGARFFGAADLASAKDFIVDQGGAFLAEYPRAISVGISLHDGIVDQLPRHKEIPVAKTYIYLYDTANATLNRIAYRLSTALAKAGYQALQIPASQYINDEKVIGLFSQKLAAHLAGLGWIGPSCLLVTPEVGPRARWVTILTDAPLEAGTPMDNQCGDCSLCVENCPPKAFTGRPFDPAEPRDLRFNVRRCIDYRKHLYEKVTGTRTCGMCLNICPFGHKDNLPS